MTELRWYVCDLLTGDVLDELPFNSPGAVRSRIGNVESTQLDLDVFNDACPPDWTTNLVDGKTLIVLTIDGEPAQGWVMIDSTIGDVTAPVNVSTLEELPSRTNVPDLDPYGLPDQDYAMVAAALAQPLVSQFGFTIEVTHTGIPFAGTGVYAAADDRKILDALNADIQAASGEPAEWRIFVRWSDDTHLSFDKVLEVRPRVGVDRPDAIFDLDADGRGTISDYRRNRSYAEGKGGTIGIGTSEGSGTSRPVTDPVVSPLVAEGWPGWEVRRNFTGLEDAADEEAELYKRTQAMVASTQAGTVTWSVTSRGGTLLPGRDFDAGDTVHIDVAANPPRDPEGGNAALRTLGWELDTVTLQCTPILWDDSTDGSDG